MKIIIIAGLLSASAGAQAWEIIGTGTNKGGGEILITSTLSDQNTCVRSCG
jgi:hypothetical protein